MNKHEEKERPRSWGQKFADSLRGVACACTAERSFRVHLPMTILVIVCGVLFHVSRLEWCILVLCIAVVLTAEVFNTSIESFARVIEPQHNPHVGKALDMASGAVLLASLGAAISGAIIFLHRLWVMYFLQTP